MPPKKKGKKPKKTTGDTSNLRPERVRELDPETGNETTLTPDQKEFVSKLTQFMYDFEVAQREHINYLLRQRYQVKSQKLKDKYQEWIAIREKKMKELKKQIALCRSTAQKNRLINEEQLALLIALSSTDVTSYILSNKLMHDALLESYLYQSSDISDVVHNIYGTEVRLRESIDRMKSSFHSQPELWFLQNLQLQYPPILESKIKTDIENALDVQKAKDLKETREESRIRHAKGYQRPDLKCRSQLVKNRSDFQKVQRDFQNDTKTMIHNMQYYDRVAQCKLQLLQTELDKIQPSSSLQTSETLLPNIPTNDVNTPSLNNGDPDEESILSKAAGGLNSGIDSVINKFHSDLDPISSNLASMNAKPEFGSKVSVCSTDSNS